MREIEFRAWDIERKVFIGYKYPYNWRFYDPGEYFDSEERISLTWISDMDKSNNFILEQYTGLKDKHGTKIFEGDICYVTHPNGEHRTKGEVYFDEGAYWIENCYIVDYDEYEVIGNIHEDKK